MPSSNFNVYLCVGVGIGVEQTSPQEKVGIGVYFKRSASLNGLVGDELEVKVCGKCSSS